MTSTVPSISTTPPAAIPAPSTARPARPARPRAKQSGTTDALIALLATLGVTGLVLLTNWAMGATDEPAARPATIQTAPALVDRVSLAARQQLTNAELDCRDAVLSRLGFPAAAQFSNLTAANRSDAKIATTGEVYSKNAYGATVRRSFACTKTGWETTVTSLG